MFLQTRMTFKFKARATCLDVTGHGDVGCTLLERSFFAAVKT
jgi:hypothetical protein